MGRVGCTTVVEVGLTDGAGVFPGGGFPADAGGRDGRAGFTRAEAVPESETTSNRFEALCTMVRLPVEQPIWRARKLTEMVQLLPGGSDAGH